MIKRLSFSIVGILFSLSLSFCQNNLGSLEGIVIDNEYQEALPFSFVQILDSGLGTYCDEQGNFLFENVEEGTYNLSVSFIGYQNLILDNIQIRSSEKTSLNIELVSEAVFSDEIIISASRKRQHFSLAPASIELVSAKEIKQKNLTSFDQAFDQMNGLNVTRSSGSNVQALSIRGASEVAGGGIGNRVLLLIDGRPALSPDSGGALWNLIPVNSVERIEVVKGAYSSLFGSSAMGGVVNVITRTPVKKIENKLHINYGFFDQAPRSTEYDEYNDYYSLAYNRSGNRGKMSYVFDASYNQTDGHREKSASDLFNLYGKVKYRFSGSRSLQIAANYNKIYNDTPATWLSARQAYSVADFRLDDYQDRRETNLDLYYEAIPNEKLKYSSRYFYYRNNSVYSFNEDPDNDTTNVNIGTSQIIDQSSVLSQRLGMTNQIDWYSKGKHYVIAGMDAYYDIINGVPDTILYGLHKAYNVGVFVQDEISLTEKLKATIGARFDHYSIINEFMESNLSPKLALLYQANQKLSFRGLLAQAYRNPSMGERFIKYEQGGGLQFETNPDLKSEKLNLSAELGSYWKLNDKMYMDFAVFYNHYENLISFQQLSNTGEALLYKVINLKESVMQGFEYQFNYKLNSNTSFKIGYTYLDAKDTSEGRLNDNLAYKVKHSAHFAINKSYKKWGLNLNGRYRSGIKEVFIYPGNEPGAYFLADSNLSYRFSKDHSAYLSVKNLTDTQYEELERYRMAGRSYTMGMRLTF